MKIQFDNVTEETKLDIVIDNKMNNDIPICDSVLVFLFFDKIYDDFIKLLKSENTLLRNYFLLLVRLTYSSHLHFFFTLHCR